MECVVCVAHGLDAPVEMVGVGPGRVGAGVIRAALAVGVVLARALLTPDPRDLEPQVLSRA